MGFYDKEKFGMDWSDQLDHLETNPFFSINGRIWTVERFREYIKKHPLQFRKEKSNNANFAENFKLAVVDLVRDYYITQDAYNKNYDEMEIVKYEVEIWRDHLLSLYQKYQYLETQYSKKQSQPVWQMRRVFGFGLRYVKYS